MPFDLLTLRVLDVTILLLAATFAQIISWSAHNIDGVKYWALGIWLILAGIFALALQSFSIPFAESAGALFAVLGAAIANEGLHIFFRKIPPRKPLLYAVASLFLLYVPLEFFGYHQIISLASTFVLLIILVDICVLLIKKASGAYSFGRSLLLFGIFNMLFSSAFRMYLMSIETLNPEWVSVVLYFSIPVVILPASFSLVLFVSAYRQEKLEQLAFKDPLTNLFNRRSFVSQANALIESNNQLTLGILDIDFFKKINDTYGHQCGDLILTSVAHTLQNCLRNDDVLARVGGEEFAVLLVDSDNDQAKEIFERLRKNVEALYTEYKHQSVNVTVSSGYKHCKKGFDFEKVYHQADTALYQAKHKGRNCCVEYRAEFEPS